MLIDFLGLAKLFHVPTLNGAGWYMSAAFVFLLVTPFIVKRDDHIILILLGVVVFTRLITGNNGEEGFTGKNSPWAFLVPFILGMIFAKYRIIDRIANKNRSDVFLGVKMGNHSYDYHFIFSRIYYSDSRNKADSFIFRKTFVKYILSTHIY